MEAGFSRFVHSDPNSRRGPSTYDVCTEQLVWGPHIADVDVAREGAFIHELLLNEWSAYCFLRCVYG